MFVKGLSTPTGLLLIKKNVISQQDQMYVQWIRIEAYSYLREMFDISSCVIMFSKFIELFAFKLETTKACLNKLVNQYFGKVIKPKVVLSDNANQFRCPSWRKLLHH